MDKRLIFNEDPKTYDKYRPSEKEIKEFTIEDTENLVSVLKSLGFKDVCCKLYHRVRSLCAEEYIGLLNTYSDHRGLSMELKV